MLDSCVEQDEEVAVVVVYCVLASKQKRRRRRRAAHHLRNWEALDLPYVTGFLLVVDGLRRWLRRNARGSRLD